MDVKCDSLLEPTDLDGDSMNEAVRDHVLNNTDEAECMVRAAAVAAASRDRVVPIERCALLKCQMYMVAQRFLCLTLSFGVLSRASPSLLVCVQIERHEAATGQTCPARMSVPGSASLVNAFKLVAITGERFLTSFPQSTPPLADPPLKRPRSAGPEPAHADEEGCTASQQADTEAAEQFVNIVDGAAPVSLSAQQALNLARLARLFLAEPILTAFPTYIMPLFEFLTERQVRNL